ncbi:hypothetical protein KC926_03905 [Candidatus Kaiserbacteria bacterium]|nr:hypothetical protein [Candidatus Kaiserbacteria bacterium]
MSKNYEKFVIAAVVFAGLLAGAVVEMIFNNTRILLHTAIAITVVAILVYGRKHLSLANHSSNSNSVTDQPRYPYLYWIITPIYFGVLLNMIGTGIDWNMDNLLDTKFIGAKTTSQQAAIYIPIMMLFMSIISLDRIESASVTCWGLAIKNFGPGPKLLPWPIFQYTIYPRDTPQSQFPGNPDEIFKGLDKDPLPPGKKRALRITTGRPEKVKGDLNPLAIQMPLEFLYFLRIQIFDPLTFEVKYGSLEGFWKAVNDSGDKLLNIEVTRMKGVVDVIENMSLLMERLEAVLKKLCEDGGVTVVESGINAPDLTHALSEAMRDMGVTYANAIADAKKIKLTGEANAGAEAVMIRETSKALANADETAKAGWAAKNLNDKTVLLGMKGVTDAFGLADAIAKHIGAKGGT